MSGPATRNPSRCTVCIEFIDPPLRARLNAVRRDGRTLWERFDRQVRSRAWHPFVPADYEAVLRDLLPHRRPGRRFLELGSATGVITVMADLLGFEAYGIEIDAELVAHARSLARRHGSGARFAVGSYLPDGYIWKSSSGDERLGTIARGEAAYAELGHELSDFDVVFAYPWYGDAPVLHDLVARRGAPGATLLLHDHPPGTAAGLRGVGAAPTAPSRPRGDRCESSE